MGQILVCTPGQMLTCRLPATRWAGKVDVLRLQKAGGWNRLAMPRRYVERARIANEGMA